MTILNYGGVEGHGSASPGYGGYGTNLYTTNGTFASLTAIQSSAFHYQVGWYNSTGVCPTLKLVIGTTNYHQCINHTNVCNPQGFGTNLGSMLATLVQQSRSYARQVYLWVGDDIESGYNSAATTLPLVDAFGRNDPNYSEFIDYGDAAGSAVWSDHDIWYAAYGARFDYALPQAYNDGQIARWMTIKREYSNYYSGVLTQNQFQGTFDAQTGWQHFWDALNANGLSQDELRYSSDI